MGCVTWKVALAVGGMTVARVIDPQAFALVILGFAAGWLWRSYV